MNTNIRWLDFNDASDQPVTQAQTSGHVVAEIKNQLLTQLPSVLTMLFPTGIQQGNTYRVGNLEGDAGKSLVIELHGEKKGLWHDFATGEGGDLLDLWAHVYEIDRDRHFPQLLESIHGWLTGEDVSTSPSLTPAQRRRQPTSDTVEQATAKWDYHDAQGQLIACVYRYDTPTGKSFRPWDVKKKRHQAPEPRPLYNLPQVIKADHIVLVEGEKAADALIQQGIVATTAMNGANAPLDKTDWSALVGKHLRIWPDNDAAGQAYAEKIAEHLAQLGCFSVELLTIPANKPYSWDAHDAVEEGIELPPFVKKLDKTIVPIKVPVDAEKVGGLEDDLSPIAEDLISPRVLTPGDMIVFGGAAKVGKSDFLLSWLRYMAAGEPFLGLTPTRPLHIFYLQAEVKRDYMRERIHAMNVPDVVKKESYSRLWITSHLKFVLDDEHVDKVIHSIRTLTQNRLDILVIDPIRNVFDGGDKGHDENDNKAMLYFLRERVEKIRDAINPKAGIILVHHTKKTSTKQLEEDTFLALSGASSLRSYYTTGMLMYRPDNHQAACKVLFELRNGSGITPKWIEKKEGAWSLIDPTTERIASNQHLEKLDAERERKRDVIVQLLIDEACAGRLYTANQFAQQFESKAGLGSYKTIHERLSILSTQGHIKFVKNGEPFAYPHVRSKFGLMCVQDMYFTTTDGDTIHVFPSHFKCGESGAVMPVENPNVWVMPADHKAKNLGELP